MFTKIRKKEVLRFLIGGGCAVLTDFSVYHLLLNFSLTISFSKGISYICGAAIGFLINKFWTFESKALRLREIACYILLYIFSALCNTAVNWLVLKMIPVNILAFLCATAVSMVLNFLGQKFFVFTAKEG